MIVTNRRNNTGATAELTRPPRGLSTAIALAERCSWRPILDRMDSGSGRIARTADAATLTQG